MMPSRGWQLASGRAPRLYQAQCRSLSSASRLIRQRPNSSALPHQRIPQWRHLVPIAIPSISAIRQASTTAHTATQPPPSTAPAEATSTAFPHLETTTLDDLDLTPDVTTIPEKIGYLHELGLNYGWGPTSMLEWTIEHIHIYGGVPWWGAVALTAVGLRVILLPLFIRSSDQVARANALMSISKPITEKMSAARAAGDTAAVQQSTVEMFALRKKAGLSFTAQMAPMVVQGIFGYCGFKLIRAMCSLPIPALPTDGFLWLQDMTISDPFLILPLAMAGTIHFLVRTGGESGATGTNQMAPAMRAAMLWGMPVIIFFGLGFQPALLCVWFASGGALGVIQGQVLQNAAVRQKLKLAPLYAPTPEERDRGMVSGLFGGSDRSGFSATSPGAASSARRSATAWMNTSYQSPNLRRNANTNAPAGRVIDVHPVNKSNPSKSSDPDMVQPNAPAMKKDGVLSQAKEKFAAFKKNYNKPLTEEELAKKRKEQFKQRAKAYEKRYQERRGR